MNTRVLCLLICLCGLFSCSTVRTISFEQLCPAKVSLPVQIGTVAVVNNMPAASEGKDNLATFGVLDGDGKASAEALAGVLADSKYFNQVVICDSALNGKRLHGNGYRLIPRKEAASLAKDLGVDAIFSLDRIILQNEKRVVGTSGLYELQPGLYEPLPVVMTKITAVLNIYSPMREKPLATVVSTDSVEWDWTYVPSDKRLLAEAAHISAGMLGRDLVPYWMQTSRVYYAGGCVEMRDAAVCVDEGDWQEAHNLWLSLYENRKSAKIKSHAALNLALASEMQGRLDEAKNWLDKAKSYIEEGSEEEMVWKFNSAQLMKRRGDFVHLQSQMSRFENN